MTFWADFGLTIVNEFWRRFWWFVVRERNFRYFYGTRKIAKIGQIGLVLVKSPL